MQRMTVEFGPDQADALERLADAMSTTKASAIRFALALLQIAVREHRAGRSLAVIKDGEVVKEITGIWSVVAIEPVGSAA